jgi:hypothetical protein
MKKLRLVILFLLLQAFLRIDAQVVVDRSNKIQLDFNKPVVPTKFPQIIWELPRLEYTNSQDPKIEIKATVTSIVPIKRIQLSILHSLTEDPIAFQELHPDSEFKSAIDKKLTLNSGQNYIQILVENTDGGNSYRQSFCHRRNGCA